MGYTLKIGQLVNRYDSELEGYRYDCKQVFLSEAPAFGEVTDHSNIRMPSYSAWEEFAEATGLHDFFFDNDQGLLNGPEGVSSLTKAHKDSIDAACVAYVQAHPEVFSVKDEALLSEEDFHFERLRWLKFWIDWALENCDSSVFINEQ